MKKIRLCYRIEKEAELAEDENGLPVACYNCVGIDRDTYNIPSKEYKKLVNAGITITAGLFSISEELITPITLNEYLDNTEEED